MTEDDRLEALLRSDAWLDGKSFCTAALDWRMDKAKEIAPVRPAQWEALLRVGAGAKTLDDFLNALRRHLCGSDPEKPRYRLRDEATTGSLLGELKRVALDETARKAAFDAEVDRLPEERRSGLGEWRKVAMARGFLSALVKRIRVQSIAEEVRKWQPQRA